MKGKLIRLFLALAMLLTLIPSAFANEARELRIGDYVQMGTYYGEPILWRCVSYGQTEKAENSAVPTLSYLTREKENGALPLLLTDQILCLKAFDANAETDNSSGSHGRRENSRASNYWVDSTIRSWLNSDAGAGEVKWQCSNPPNAESVWNGYNAYDGEAGFLTSFTDDELNVMQTVSHKYVVSKPEIENNMYAEKEEVYGIRFGYFGGSQVSEGYVYTDFAEDTVFLPSAEEIGMLEANVDFLGQKYKIGTFSNQCIKSSDYEPANFNAGNAWNYWLRNPNADSTGSVMKVTNFGEYDSAYAEIASNSSIGVRPAFHVKEDVEFTSGSGKKEDPYIIGESTARPSQTAEPKTLTVKSGAEISVYVNGERVGFPDAKPFVDENNRTQVPIRAVSEMLECSVKWSQETKTATITRESGETVKITAGSNIMIVNDKTVVMDTFAAVVNDRTYIPVRFVGEALGLKVEWNK